MTTTAPATAMEPAPDGIADRPLLRQTLIFGSPLAAAMVTIGLLELSIHLLGSSRHPGVGSVIFFCGAAASAFGSARGTRTIHRPVAGRAATTIAAGVFGTMAYVTAFVILAEPGQRSQNMGALGFLGFLCGIPAGIVSGFRQTPTKPAWKFVAFCLVAAVLLGLSRERFGLRELFLGGLNAAIWYPLTADVTRMLLYPFRGRRGQAISRTSNASDDPAVGNASVRPAVREVGRYDLAACPVCQARILPKANGACPLCGTLIAPADP